MKANEFVRNLGLNKAKVLLSTQGKTIANLKSEYTTEQLKEYQKYIVSGDLMNFVKLKQLIESHDLVESYGGLLFSKAQVQLVRAAINSGVDLDEDVVLLLEKSIADVESCM